MVWTNGNLSNTGSEIRLVNAKGQRIDAVQYNADAASCAGQTIVF